MVPFSPGIALVRKPLIFLPVFSARFEGAGNYDADYRQNAHDNEEYHECFHSSPVAVLLEQSFYLPACNHFIRSYRLGSPRYLSVKKKLSGFLFGTRPERPPILHISVPSTDRSYTIRGSTCSEFLT
jgi:hypothetical protein